MISVLRYNRLGGFIWHLRFTDAQPAVRWSWSLRRAHVFLTLVRVETLPNVVLMPAMLTISAFARAAARASASSMPVSRSRIIVSMILILAESPGRIFSAGTYSAFLRFSSSCHFGAVGEICILESSCPFKFFSIRFIRYAARKPARLVLQDECGKVHFVL